MAFYSWSNFITLTLNTTTHPSGLGTGDLTITVNEAISSLQTQGWLTIDRASAGSREIVKWTSYDAGTKTFTVTRGQDGTSAATHTTACTIAITPNAAYLASLKTYVDDSFAATPVGIGSVTPSTGAFTTLSASGAATLAGVVHATAANATEIFYATATHTTGNQLPFRSVVTSSGTGNYEPFTTGHTVVTGATLGFADAIGSLFEMTGGSVSVVNLTSMSMNMNGGSVSEYNGMYLGGTITSGTLTQRNIIKDISSSGTNQYFLDTTYSIGSGVTASATSVSTVYGVLKVRIGSGAGPVTKYIPIYSTYA